MGADDAEHKVGERQNSNALAGQEKDQKGKTDGQHGPMRRGMGKT